MSIHIDLLKQAFAELELKGDITLENADSSGVFMKLTVRTDTSASTKSYYFKGTRTPFNSGMISHIMADKEQFYSLVSDRIKIPRTISFVDPHATGIYESYATESSTTEIAEKVANELNFPLIIKPNSKSTGINIAKVENKKELKLSLDQIFQNNKDYDHVALVQEFIKIKKEYRVVIFKGKIKFVYLKDNSTAVFTGNLSPLHWEGAKAILIDNVKNKNAFEEIKMTVEPILADDSIEYAGLDIAEAEGGAYYLLEANSNPAYNHFIADNGPEQVLELYKDMLLELVDGSAL